mmetsp:Transcript_20791/g.70787  ORF Transcript_20791/g.70787 Transcript_20791/m.70787 type:complete len:470 (+) Transcript_20791:58-1467(+)
MAALGVPVAAAAGVPARRRNRRLPAGRFTCARPSAGASAAVSAAEVGAPPGAVAAEAVRVALGVAGLASAPAALAAGVGPLLGTVAALTVLTAALLLAPERWAARAHAAVGPASRFIDSWLGLFFVPYVASLAASPLPSGAVLASAAALVVTFYGLTAVAAVTVFRTVSSLVDPPEREGPPPGEGAPPPPAALALQRASGWGAAAAAAALAPAGAALAAHGLSTHVAAAPSALLATLAAYEAARLVPVRLQRLGLFPTVTVGAAAAVGAAAVGAAGIGWREGVRVYLAGAGDVLLWFVTPAVVALAFKIHAQRAAIRQHLVPMAAAISTVPLLMMLATASAGRLLGLPAEVTLAALPKHTTTGLAVPMSLLLGVDPAWAAAAVVVIGTLGISVGPVVLDAMRVRGPAARGVATGITAHAAGTLGLQVAGEAEAAALSSATFALAGVVGVLLCSAPAFRNLVLSLATGAL